ncbi:hypothetical protein HDU85_005204 [Gaertneriomyces sp. JEL0708]|nr:hypothetical protein HDU85_005204 [Gaertneriomyces sp. JEL0708]
MAATKQSHWALENEDILYLLFDYLEDRRDQLSAALTCKRWSQVGTQYLWKHVDVGTRIPFGVPQNEQCYDGNDLEWMEIPPRNAFKFARDSDTIRLERMLELLSRNQALARHTRHLTVNLEFFYDEEFFSDNYQTYSYTSDVLAVPSDELISQAWDLFLSRSELCMRVMELLTHVVDFRLNVNVRTQWEHSFYQRLAKVLRIAKTWARLKTLHLKLGKLSRLQDFSQFQGILTDTGIQDAIVSLDISDSSHWRGRHLDMIHLLNSVGPLKSLILRPGTLADIGTLGAIMRHIPTLRSLRFHDDPVNPDILFEHILPQARSLREFIVDNPTWHLPQTRIFNVNCPNLVHLNVDGYPRVRAAFFEAVARQCPKLEVLSAQRNRNITDGQVGQLLMGCMLLKFINFNYCESLRGTTLELIRQYRGKKLRKVSLKGCFIWDAAADVLLRTADRCGNLKDILVGPIPPTPELIGWRIVGHYQHDPADVLRSLGETDIWGLLPQHHRQYVRFDMQALRGFSQVIETYWKKSDDLWRAVHSSS